MTGSPETFSSGSAEVDNKIFGMDDAAVELDDKITSSSGEAVVFDDKITNPAGGESDDKITDSV